MVAAQNPFAWLWHMKQEEYTIGTMVAYDDAALESQIRNLSCLDPEKAVEPVNAKISEYVSRQGYSIEPEQEGTAVEAEKLTQQAQNALLKTIEEPPAYGIIILLTTNADTFLQTILSRCVRLDFRPLRDTLVTQYLQEKYDLTDYERRFATAFAQGKIGRAVTIATSKEFAQLKEEVMHVIRYAKEMTTAEIMAEVKNIANYKLTIDDYLDLMAMWYRDVLVFKST